MKKILLSVMLTAISIITSATTLIVTNSNDAGAGSLRAQVAAASPGDTIMFDASLIYSTIVLTSGHISIQKDLTIIGLGYNKLAISGNNNSRMFYIKGVDVSIRGLIFIDGNQTDMLDNDGGAILHSDSGNLTLNNVYFYNNKATNGNGSQAGAVGFYSRDYNLTADSCFFVKNLSDNYGGVISLNARPASGTFNYCVFDSNQAIGSDGVLFSNAKEVTFSNSTIINNTSAGTIMRISDALNATFTNTTIANNIEASPYSLVSIDEDGTYKFINCTIKDNNGPIAVNYLDDPTTLIIQNTIFDNTGENFKLNGSNTSFYLTFTSLGGNVSSDTSMKQYLTATNDTNDVNPMLGALTDFGIHVKAYPLNCGSVASNNGVAAGAPMMDQRGMPRYREHDAGAYEQQPILGTDVQVACRSFKWIDGVTYTASNSVAKDTITLSSGCDSIVTLNLTVNNVTDITTTVTDSLTITVDNSNGTYQWLDCNNAMSPITDSTNQSINPQGSGNYAVEITENGCKDTSDCVKFIRSSIIENTFSDKFTVYPNPTAGNFALMFDNVQEELTIQLVTVSGQVLESKVVRNTNRIDMELTQPTGVYLLKMVDNKGNVAVLRLVKN